MRLDAPDGTFLEVSISLERIIELEAQDPEWSVLSLISKLSSMRVTDADAALRMIGTSYAEIVEHDFGYLDVGWIMQCALMEVGFLTPSVIRSEEPSGTA